MRLMYRSLLSIPSSRKLLEASRPPPTWNPLSFCVESSEPGALACAPPASKVSGRKTRWFNGKLRISSRSITVPMAAVSASIRGVPSLTLKLKFAVLSCRRKSS